MSESKTKNVALVVIMGPILLIAVVLAFGFFGTVSLAIWYVFIWLLFHWETWFAFAVLVVVGLIMDRRRPKVRDSSGRLS